MLARDLYQTLCTVIACQHCFGQGRKHGSATVRHELIQYINQQVIIAGTKTQMVLRHVHPRLEAQLISSPELIRTTGFLLICFAQREQEGQTAGGDRRVGLMKENCWV